MAKPPEAHAGAERILQKKPTQWERFLAGEIPASCPACACTTMICSLLFSFVVAFGMFKTSTVFGFFVLSNPNTAAFLANMKVRDVNYFTDKEGEVVEKVSFMLPYRSRSMDLINICMEVKDTGCPGDDCDLTSKNALQLNNLKLLQELETEIWNSEIYQKSMCAIKDRNNTRCMPPSSVLQLLLFEGDAPVDASKDLVAEGYGETYWDCQRWVSPADKQEEGSCWSNWWSYANASLGAGKLKSDLSEYNSVFDRLCTEGDTFWIRRQRAWLPRFACKDGHLQTHGTPFLLSALPVGLPWNEDIDIQDINWMEQFNDMKTEYGIDIFEAIKESTDKILSGRDDINLVTSGAVVDDADESAQLMDTARNMALTLFLVFLYMWFTVESLLLASMAMLQIMGAVFPSAIIWITMNPSGIQFLQFIAVFLVLGIGADDVFVFNDAFKQSKAELANVPTSQPIHVFMLAYRRSFSAMLATTCTSSLAMFFGSLNPIPAISNFCIFAGIMIVWDLLLTVSFYCSIAAFEDRYMAGQKYGCVGGPAEPGSFCQTGCCFGILRSVYRRILGIPHEQTSQQRKLEEFFSGPFLEAVNKFKFALIAFWILVFAATTTSAILLVKVTEKNPEGRAPDHPAQRCATIQAEYFSSAGNNPNTLLIVFGLDQDDPVAKWNATQAESVEEARFGDITGATSQEGQQKILELCQAPSESAGTARCFDKDMCIVSGSPSRCEVKTANGFPVPKDGDCNSGRYCIMEQVRDYAVKNGLEFPVPDLFKVVNSTSFRDYLRDMFSMYQDIERDYEIDNYKQGTGVILEDGQIKYMWLTFNATFEGAFLPPAQGAKIYDAWEQFVTGYIGGIDHHMLNIMFVFKTMQDMLVQEAMKSIGASMAVALVTLCAVTWNWQISILGLMNLVFIVSFFMGSWPLLGWELDIFNVIFTIMAVGLSVDYTVHLLHAYNASTHESSYLRVKDALAEMGITVLSGAVTTLLAPVPLINDPTVFFQRFARFIFLIISISIVMALLNLIPWLLLAGPGQGQGQITPLYMMAKMFSGMSKSDDSAGNGTAGNGTAGNGMNGHATAGNDKVSSPYENGNGNEYQIKVGETMVAVPVGRSVLSV